MKTNGKQKLITMAAVLLLLGWASSCTNQNDAPKAVKNTDTVNLAFTVAEAPEWTALFFRNSGWFGADGIFAFPVNGVDTAGSADSTLLIFSDSMVGEIKDGEMQPGTKMVNNTVAYVKKGEPKEENIRFYWAKDDKGNPTSMFVPNTPLTQKGDYYWLGDGFVNTEKNNDLYMFGYRMHNVSDKEWGFAEMSNVLIVIPAGSKPPFTDQRQIETPLSFRDESDADKGSFGAGILVNTKDAGVPDPDGYLYVYGVRGQAKNLVVARVLPKDIEDFTAWRFWDGNDWNADIKATVNVVSGVSNELSVSPLPDGRYALVYQENGMGSTVGLRLGLTPQGPFGPQIPLWTCTEPQKKNIIVYNAKNHPALAAPNELLVSYNVNAFDFNAEMKADPNLYRPRFIRVKLQ